MLETLSLSFLPCVCVLSGSLLGVGFHWESAALVDAGEIKLALDTLLPLCLHVYSGH